jgi:hypothetical protein
MNLTPEQSFLNDVMGGSMPGSDYSIPKHSPLIPKPPVRECQILLKSESKLNDKLLDFFKRNLKKLNGTRTMFEWVVVYEDEVEYYEDQDIDKFPAMVLNGNITFGLTDIKKALNELVFPNKSKPVTNNKRSQQPSQKDPPKFTDSTGDDVRDYFLNDINKNEKCDEVDETNEFGQTLSRRMTAMMEARAKSGMPSKATSSSLSNTNTTKNNGEIGSTDVMDIVTKNNTGSGEDDLMERYWQNQELTEI